MYNYNVSLERKEEIVTQLVGAICDHGKKIVTVSDRMVSTSGMTLTFEQERTKAVKISNNSVILTAGTVHQPDLLRQAKEEARGKDRIVDIAEILKTAYQEIRERAVIDEVLFPDIGIRSFSEWHDKQTKLHDATVMRLSDKISHFQLGLLLLFAGMDEEGHIIRIDDPGVCTSYDTLSFCCIGIGNRHAETVFAYYRYSRAFSLKEALYIAFEAKKKAEMAGGVGQTSDLLIIDSDGIKVINDDTVEALEEIYYEREARAERTGFDKRILELEIQTTQMED